MNPTRYHLGNLTPYEDLIQEDQHKRDFQNWLDGTLFLHQEMKVYLQPSQHNQASTDKTIDEQSF